MTRFAERQHAESAFPELVSQRGLNLWKPGDAIPARGRRVLLGVATYSILDLKLLDLIATMKSQIRLPIDRIDVFDTVDCRSMSDIAQYVPGIGDVYQTPVVGLWVDGVLVDNAWGAEGRALAGRALGIADRVREMVESHYQSLESL